MIFILQDLSKKVDCVKFTQSFFRPDTRDEPLAILQSIVYETKRQHLRNRIRRAKTPEEDYSLIEQCREITKKLTPLRKQLIICERIENKVPRLRALIEQEKQLEQGRYKYKYYHQNKTKQRSYER